MKKNTFLGINGTRAIVLCTPYTFEQLEQNTADIEESDFIVMPQIGAEMMIY